MKQSDLKSQIAEIFEHWQDVMDKPQARMIVARSRAIAGRLREGYSVADIKSAIDGCRISPFHMGENDAGNIYNDLTLICRNGAKLEQFIGFLEKRPRKPSYGNDPDADCDRCNNERRTYYNFDFPSHPCPKCRPLQNRAWLKERGKI